MKRTGLGKVQRSESVTLKVDYTSFGEINKIAIPYYLHIQSAAIYFPSAPLVATWPKVSVRLRLRLCDALGVEI